jgi:lipoyl(octanoyl) transferase
MSSEVEMVGAVHGTARGRLRSIAPTCETIFATLEVYHDIAARSAALNMAIDEALLERATQPTIRFYRWDHPALSFGYFGVFSDVVNHESERDIVRRWTGGGIVFHGNDLTYSIVIPANDPAFAESSRSIYEKTHRAIQSALGSDAQLASIASPKISESCFANPVRADVLLNGRKVAGAAQRRTRRGLLQQGSIQNVDFGNGFTDEFANELCRRYRAEQLHDAVLARARKIAKEKYSTAAWLRRR